MLDHVVHTERNHPHHLIEMGTLDGHPVFMNFSATMKSATKSDEKRGYKDPVQGGPMQQIEIERAKEYAGYVRQYISQENINRFNTILRDGDSKPVLNKQGEAVRGYYFFQDMSSKT